MTRIRVLLPVLGLTLFLAGCSADTGAGTAAVQDDSHDQDDSHGHDDGGEADRQDGDTAGVVGPVEIDHHGNAIHDEVFYEKIDRNGVTVEFTMQSFLGVGGRGGDLASELVEGASSAVVLKISDSETGRPLPDLHPAAWIDPAPSTASEDQCRASVASYLSGSVFTRPLIDLNGYFLLALNDGPSISVIEPTIDVGGMTNLYTSLPLAGRGADWSMDGDQRRLAVTIPSTGQVAIADLDALAVLRHLDVGAGASRVVAPPEGTTFWVGLDGPTDGGVVAVDADAMEVAAHIPTGAGRHDLAFSRDGGRVFVTNDATSELTVIDVRGRATIGAVEVGPGARDVEASPITDDLYVLLDSGELVVVDADGLTVRRRTMTAPRASSIASSPDGRWILVTDPATGRVLVLDSATGTLRHEVAVDGASGEIVFSGRLAYVPSASTSQVTHIDLSTLETTTPSSATVALADTPVGGAAPPGPVAVTRLPHGEGVYVAIPALDEVALLQAGAAAPAGAFQGHGLHPRDVVTLDRSLREREPGIFTGRFRIPAAGDLQVALALDEPDVVHCFPFQAGADPSATSSAVAAPQVELLAPRGPVDVGADVSVRFRLQASDGDAPIDTISDLSVVAVHTGGTWSVRLPARSLGGGVYELTVQLPFEGSYALSLESAAAGLNLGDVRPIHVRAGGEPA